MVNSTDKRGIRTSDVWVVRAARFLTQLRVWVLVGTVLVICVGVYAIAWAMKRN